MMVPGRKRWARLVAAAVGAVVALPAGQPLFLVDDTALPTAVISWPTAAGGVVRLEGRFEYTAPNSRTFLGENVEGFVSVGGARVDWGAGHPDGSVVRVGFYKHDPRRPFFADIADRAEITVELRGVRFQRPGVVHPETIVQHVKYDPGDAARCGVGTDLDQYNTFDPADTMRGKLNPANSRPGSLNGDDPSDGLVEVSTGADGTVTLRARLPYALLRHARDPWRRTNPGTFLEPTHFHVEFETVAADSTRGFGEDAVEPPPGE